MIKFKMQNNFSFTKFLIITFLTFILIDVFFGKYIYKKFIRSNYKDVDRSYIIGDPVYHHKLQSNFQGLVGWKYINYRFCTDVNGFRNSCDEIILPSKLSTKLKEFDIGIIGNSFTEGVGYIYEKSFVSLINSKIKNKKIANLSVLSYSPSIYYAKINSLLSEGYKFDEIIVFLDLGNIVDDVLCYKLENEIVVTRKTHPICLSGTADTKTKIRNFTSTKLRLTYELYSKKKYKLIQYNIIDYKGRDSDVNSNRSNWTYAYDSRNYNNFTYDESVKSILSNMKKLSKLLKKNKIGLSVAVYPWPGTLINDIEENKYVKIWEDFCVTNCKNFFNLVGPFFDLLENEKFSNIHKKFYMYEDVHFNENGHKFIANNFLKLYKD